jgi:outer membrane protein OmpA-like peptidoglycan-associated protein
VKTPLSFPRVTLSPITALCFAASLILSACSAVPEEIDPTELLGSSEPVPENSRIVPPPDESDGSYPNLAQVPARPKPVTPFSERQALEEELRRDYDIANYSNEPLRSSRVDLAAGTMPVNLGRGPALIVYFLDGETRLDEQDRIELERIAVAQATLGAAVRVVGYASGASDPVAGFRQSGDRADAVASHLERLGVPSAAIVTQAVGIDTRRFGSDPLGPRAEIFLDIGNASR